MFSSIDFREKDNDHTLAADIQISCNNTIFYFSSSIFIQKSQNYFTDPIIPYLRMNKNKNKDKEEYIQIPIPHGEFSDPSLVNYYLNYIYTGNLVITLEDETKDETTDETKDETKDETSNDIFGVEKLIKFCGLCRSLICEDGEKECYRLLGKLDHKNVSIESINTLISFGLNNDSVPLFVMWYSYLAKTHGIKSLTNLEIITAHEWQNILKYIYVKNTNKLQEYISVNINAFNKTNILTLFFVSVAYQKSEQHRLKMGSAKSGISMKHFLMKMEICKNITEQSIIKYINDTDNELKYHLLYLYTKHIMNNNKSNKISSLKKIYF